MAIPLFPSLTPRFVDSSWFSIEKPCNDDSELTQLEHEHRNWLSRIAQKDSDLIPIGKTATEREEEEEEEEEDDDTNDDEESETQDDEDDDMEVDVSYDRPEPPASNE